MALVLQHAVQTLRLEAARPLVRRLAVALGDLGDVGGEDLNLPHRFVDLEPQKRRDAFTGSWVTTATSSFKDWSGSGP